jgi:glycosyltransferase involved in cell wall biosynthesis
LIFIGRLERWKGAEWLIEACSRVSAKIAVHLRIVGDFGNARQQLLRRVMELRAESTMVLLGSHLPSYCVELFAASDVLVLSSVLNVVEPSYLKQWLWESR